MKILSILPKYIAGGQQEIRYHYFFYIFYIFLLLLKFGLQSRRSRSSVRSHFNIVYYRISGADYCFCVWLNVACCAGRHVALVEVCGLIAVEDQAYLRKSGLEQFPSLTH